MAESMDRRQDVGQKMFLGIITSILTTIFIASLGLSIRNYEINNSQDISIDRFIHFMESQSRLNDKLTDLLEGRAKLPMVMESLRQGDK